MDRTPDLQRFALIRDYCDEIQKMITPYGNSLEIMLHQRHAQSGGSQLWRDIIWEAAVNDAPVRRAIGDQQIRAFD